LAAGLADEAVADVEATGVVLLGVVFPLAVGLTTGLDFWAVLFRLFLPDASVLTEMVGGVILLVDEVTDDWPASVVLTTIDPEKTVESDTTLVVGNNTGR
jgi:hypothetical protein